MANVRQRKSNMHGSGLFSTKDMKKGSHVFTFTGTHVHIAHSKLNHRCLQVSHWEFINPTRKHLGWYLNHSCTPNCYVVGKNKIFSLKNIKKGDEITIDYSFNCTDKDWKMRCCCGKNNCRKTITAFQLLPKNTKMKGIRYASQHIKEFFE